MLSLLVYWATCNLFFQPAGRSMTSWKSKFKKLFFFQIKKKGLGVGEVPKGIMITGSIKLI